ncbi:MAG: NAD(P)-dependent dehydrogenase (short-subunit alcohol dehydrogenase family) [Saprospiraceae bacterium]
MKGRRVLITGGNNGIGKATAIGLARRNAAVIIACRNETKGKAAVEEIKKISKNENVSLLICDLSSFKSIQKCADDFKSKYDSLDVLVNNAGLINDTPAVTKEGFEWQFGINHLGHFYLTHLLMKSILATRTPRIVNVSSIAHYTGKIDFDTLEGMQEDYSSMGFYAQSKLANILFTKSLAKKYPKILANCLHPGVVGTDFGADNLAWYFRSLWKLAKPFLMSPEKGASTSVYLASSPLMEVSGKYFEKVQEKRPSKLAENEALAEKLWNYSEKMIEKYKV